MLLMNARTKPAWFSTCHATILVTVRFGWLLLSGAVSKLLFGSSCVIGPSPIIFALGNALDPLAALGPSFNLLATIILSNHSGSKPLEYNTLVVALIRLFLTSPLGASSIRLLTSCGK
jgi:hypothetical protein